MKRTMTSRQRKPRIFIHTCAFPVYFTSLAPSLEQQGMNVILAGWTPAKDQLQPRPQPGIVRLYEGIQKRRFLSKKGSLFLRAFWRLLSTLMGFALLLWSIPHRQVYIFPFGRSFFNNGLDLFLLRCFGKTIISHVGFGSEARPPYLNGAQLLPDGSHRPPNILAARSQRMKKKIARIEKLSSFVMCSPCTAQFLSRPFINSLLFGLPRSINTERYKATENKGGIRILHAPSKPIVKGTQKIREAITRLQVKGYAIEYVEMTGRPLLEVYRELAICDFVVDQVFSDSPLSGFATEAAWFGKPAVVGGYAWNLLHELLPNDSFPPSHICHPDDLESAIEQLIVDMPLRTELGNKAQAFVSKNRSADHVAARYSKLIEDGIPPWWWCDPSTATYLHGCGLHENQTKAILRELIQTCGVNALQLSHRPDLEKALTRFAGCSVDP